MVSDQEIANGVETLLCQSDPNTITTLNGVVKQLGLVLGFDLSHKTVFIRDQINHLFRAHPKPPPPPPPPQPHSSINDHFNLQHHLHPQQQHIQQQQQYHPQFHGNVYQQQQFASHFALLQRQQQQQQQRDFDFGSLVRQHRPSYPQIQPHVQPQRKKSEVFTQNAATAAVSSVILKESAPAATKRRGGAGGLNKLCGCSPELQAIVGQPTLSRTEIVKHLWAYIRKHKLQDPSNKRKIVCDEPLRVLFETDITDMFKMNKLLSKHIIPLEPTKDSSKAKRLKAEVQSTIESAELAPAPRNTASSAVIISEALSEFFGSGEREMLQSEAVRRVWEYIKVNLLEDPLNPTVILCDAKLQELLGCESISTLEISEILTRHHVSNQS